VKFGMVQTTAWSSVCALAFCGAATAPNAAADFPPRTAVECRVRGGLPNFFAKLAAGDAVRIAYLGGSITAQPGWRVFSRKWFQEQYPRASIREINAAIGGTGSDLGVFRLRHDVLRFKPDLLFVEFAVNDGGAPPDRIQKTMEGIVRQAWKADPTTDICFVYTATQGMMHTLQEGKFPRAAGAMEAVADHYGIPSIHMALRIAEMGAAGKVIFKGDLPRTAARKKALGDTIVFSRDGVRPGKSGAAYRKIWNTALDESPLLTTTRMQSEKIARNSL